MTQVHAASQREQQREGEIGHGFVEQARRVGNDDACFCCGRNINGVVTDAPARNDFQFGGGRGGQDGAREFVHARHHCVYVRQKFEQFICGQRAEFRRRDDVATGIAQELQRGGAHVVHGSRRNQNLPGHGGGV